jgi:DNA-binding NarL/FixJ family response regulator
MSQTTKWGETEKDASPPRFVNLTPSERRLLEFLAAGMGRQGIADTLHLSPQTVSHALTIAKEKLGARTLTEAVVRLLLQAPL